MYGSIYSKVGPTELLFILLLIIAAIVAVFMLFIRHNAPYAHTNAFGRHINFDHYHLDTIVKVLYTFALFMNVLIGLSIIHAGFQMSDSFHDGRLALAGLIMGPLTFAILQGCARMMHEVAIIYVHMAEDVRGIRDAQGYARPASQARQPHASVAPQAYAPQNPVAPQPVTPAPQPVAPKPVSPAPARPAAAPSSASQKTMVSRPVVSEEQNVWTCAECGTSVTGGQFCSKCGSKRA